MIIAGTGHRPNKLNNEYDMRNMGPLSLKIKESCKNSMAIWCPTQVISGMALGFDQILAVAAIEMGIPVLAAVPFVGQESKWPTPSQEFYRELLNNNLVTTKIVCEGGYAPWKMQARNVFMVDLLGPSDILLACWDGSDGGTGNCVADAKKKNKFIVRIDFCMSGYIHGLPTISLP